MRHVVLGNMQPADPTTMNAEARSCSRAMNFEGQRSTMLHTVAVCADIGREGCVQSSLVPKPISCCERPNLRTVFLTQRIASAVSSARKSCACFFRSSISPTSLG